MVKFETIQVPAYEFQFNLVVYPLPATAKKTVSLIYTLKANYEFINV